MDMEENPMTLHKSLSRLTLSCRTLRVSNGVFFYTLQVDTLADAHDKFLDAVKASRPIYEILHIATLAQEASELSSFLVVANGADRHCFCSLFAPSASKMPPLSVSTNLAWWVRYFCSGIDPDQAFVARPAYQNFACERNRCRQRYWCPADKD
jgi:hypothetical protein